MSQEYPRKARRVARTQRNRPVLAIDQEALLVAEDSPDPGTNQETTSDSNETKAQNHLPGFFSVVEKNREDDETTKEVDVAQARLARATRGKTTPQQVDEEAANEKTETPTAEAGPAARPAAVRASQRPASAFKTRYILGFAIYILAADLLGSLEAVVVNQLGLERNLVPLGGSLQIKTSTLVYLATLILLLIVLAKLDFLPRSIIGSGGTRPMMRSQTANSGIAVPPTQQIAPDNSDGKEKFSEFKANSPGDQS